MLLQRRKMAVATLESRATMVELGARDDGREEEQASITRYMLFTIVTHHIKWVIGCMSPASWPLDASSRNLGPTLCSADLSKTDIISVPQRQHKQSLVRAPSVGGGLDSALASEIFDHFCNAQTFKSILRSHRHMCEALRLKPCQFPSFYPR